MIPKAHNVSLIFAWIATILAIFTVAMQSYADYYIFVTFVNSLGTFIQYNLPNIPYYILPLGITFLTIKRKLKFLWITILFLPFIIKNQASYLVSLWEHPNTLILEYTKFLAIFTCLMVLFSLLATLFYIVQDRTLQKRK
jgi:hypothetical protein